MFPYWRILTWIPTNCNKPPTLYALLNSIVNYNNENKVPIKDLASSGREKIFNFSYPLSDKISKESFETMILNHFLMRRIGYETFTSWQIALNVKLNEIMPYYNTLLDSIIGWDLFNDGETINRNQLNNRNIDTLYNGNSNGQVNVESTNIDDMRYSNMPQDHLEDIQDGSYISEYNYNQTNNINKTTSNNTTQDTTNVKDNDKITETINRSPGDKISILKQFMSEIRSVYSMIFKELDNLFYGLE